MFAIAFTTGSGIACFWRATVRVKSRCSIRQWVAGFRFASELKALLADAAFNRKINPAALDCYLMMGYVPGDSCMLESARKLPPAHALTYDLASAELKIWRYWSFAECA